MLTSRLKKTKSRLFFVSALVHFMVLVWRHLDPFTENFRIRFLRVLSARMLDNISKVQTFAGINFSNTTDRARDIFDKFSDFIRISFFDYLNRVGRVRVNCCCSAENGFICNSKNYGETTKCLLIVTKSTWKIFGNIPRGFETKIINDTLAWVGSF